MPKARTPAPTPSAGSTTGSAPVKGDEHQALVHTLQKLGFVPSPGGPLGLPGSVAADLWVRPPGATTHLAPVFVEAGTPDTLELRADRLVARWSKGLSATTSLPRTASILVVESDQAAELTGQKIVASSPLPLPEAAARTRILVQPARRASAESHAHWHRIRLPPRTVLMIATGILVGLAQRAERSGSSGEEGSGVPIDVEGMFRELRRTFNVDVEGSLGVAREEDAMFLLYQLALRETYAPGDQGASLHELVNDPKGPAARLPWFAI